MNLKTNIQSSSDPLGAYTSTDRLLAEVEMSKSIGNIWGYAQAPAVQERVHLEQGEFGKNVNAVEEGIARTDQVGLIIALSIAQADQAELEVV